MRYLRQAIFEKLGKDKQKLLEQSNVAIMGLGAIGSISAELLARAGVNLDLFDRDIVELSNLQRQKLFSEDDIGKAKAAVTNDKLEKINSSIDIKYNIIDVDYDNIGKIKADLILDCTDNFETRFLINEFAIKNDIPWIYAAVVGSSGMSMNILPKKTACFKCVFKEPTALLGSCDTEGIINTIPNIISAIQTTEAIKILTKQDYSKELIHFNVWENKLVKNRVNKLTNCPACNGKFEYLNGKKKNELIKYCGTNSYQIKTNLNLDAIKERFKRIGDVKTFPYCVCFDKITAFKDRVLIKAQNKEEAKSIFDRYLK